MQILRFFSIALLICFVTLSCKKNDVPESTGYAFKLEPLSVSKISNGDQYMFGSIDFSSTFDVALQIKTAQDTANCSIWNIYLVTANGDKYFVSGLGANKTSYYYTHHFYSSSNEQVSLIIARTSGVAETYSSILVTRYNWR